MGPTCEAPGSYLQCHRDLQPDMSDVLNNRALQLPPCVLAGLSAGAIHLRWMGLDQAHQAACLAYDTAGAGLLLAAYAKDRLAEVPGLAAATPPGTFADPTQCNVAAVRHLVHTLPSTLVPMGCRSVPGVSRGMPACGAWSPPQSLKPSCSARGSQLPAACTAKPGWPA